MAFNEVKDSSLVWERKDHHSDSNESGFTGGVGKDQNG